MRGMDALIAMRRKNKRPDKVFIDVDMGLGTSAADWLQVQAGDSPARSDLRALARLSVVVAGEDLDAVFAWARACSKAGASNVFIKWAEHGSLKAHAPVIHRLDGVDTEAA